MSLLTPPPLKEKPPNPTPPLPVPKRKGIAFLMIAFPTLVGYVVGWLAGKGSMALAPLLPDGWMQTVTYEVLPALLKAAGVSLGVWIGLRTLMSVLLYGASQKPATSKPQNVP